jgi:zinc/manganese transport system substrate-binding protein
MAAGRKSVTRRGLLLAGLAAPVAARTAAAQEQPQHRIKAVATISILADLIANVGGDRADIATLVGPNGDPHVYSPAPGDARKLAQANVVFANGLGLEGWMTRLVEASGSRAPLCIVSTGIALRHTNDERNSRLMLDPHGWQSVANAKVYVANIRDEFGAIDPAGRATYDANAAAYLEKLDVLEREIRAAISSIPANDRKVITVHDAFGYFGDAYGMQFITAQGVSTDAEPTAKVVAKIITQMKKDRIAAVFMENAVDPRIMQEIARETGARIGGTLYADALSAPGGPAGTYIDMMGHNARAFSTALTG